MSQRVLKKRSVYICIFGEGIQTELLHINIVFNIFKVETRKKGYIRHSEGCRLYQKYWICMYKIICIKLKLRYGIS